MLAPPWISVPPPGYGGVESVVSVLTEALVQRGHSVTLFCAPGSVSSAHVVTLLEESHPDEIERSLYEVDHVARAFETIDLAPYSDRFDVVHDHCGFTALAMADRLDAPFVHTLHGQFTASTAAFYAHHGHKAALVGISRAQLASAPAGLQAAGAIPNPIHLQARACGTPVIAFPEGAARELVLDGKTGFLVDDERAMAAAVGRLPGIAARDCRAWVAEHCDGGAVAAAYESTYRSVAHQRTGAVALV